MSALLYDGNENIQRSFINYCTRTNDSAFFKGMQLRIESAKVCAI